MWKNDQNCTSPKNYISFLALYFDKIALLWTNCFMYIINMWSKVIGKNDTGKTGAILKCDWNGKKVFKTILFHIQCKYAIDRFFEVISYCSVFGSCNFNSKYRTLCKPQTLTIQHILYILIFCLKLFTNAFYEQILFL
jgi:hypothetical protein